MVQVKIYFSKRQIMQLQQKRHLTLAIFGEIFMKFKKRAHVGYVMRTFTEWRKLVPKRQGNLIPLLPSRGRIDVSITRNKIFLTPPRELRTQTKEDILKNCKYLGRFELTEANTKQLQEMYPGFRFTFLEKFVRLPQIRDIDFFRSRRYALNTTY